MSTIPEISTNKPNNHEEILGSNGPEIAPNRELGDVPNSSRMEMLKSFANDASKVANAFLPRLELTNFTAEDKQRLVDQKQQAEANRSRERSTSDQPARANSSTERNQVNAAPKPFFDFAAGLRALQDKQERERGLPPEGNTPEEKYARRIFIAINEYRKSQGLKELKYSPKVEARAQRNSQECANNNRMDHYFSGIEVAGAGHNSVKSLMADWKQSTPHDKIILDPSLRYMGVSVINGFETAHFSRG